MFRKIARTPSKSRILVPAGTGFAKLMPMSAAVAQPPESERFRSRAALELRHRPRRAADRPELGGYSTARTISAAGFLRIRTVGSHEATPAATKLTTAVAANVSHGIVKTTGISMSVDA